MSFHRPDITTTAFFIVWFFATASVVLYFSYLHRNFQLDDALIYLRYIKNFQQGYGLVYNPGEKFNGLTSPLYTYMMIFLSSVIFDLQFLTVLVSCTFLFFTSIISSVLFSASRFGRLLTSLVVASFGYFYLTIGMETSLFLFLICLCLFCYKNDSDFFVISLSLLMITRIEGIFLAVPLGVSYIITKRRLPKLPYIIFSLCIFFIPFIFNRIYYGEFFAATGSAKIGQGKSGLWGQGWIFFHVDYLYDWVFAGHTYLAVILALFSFLGIILLWKNNLAVISLIFVVFLMSFYSFFNIPNYHWYYAPFFLFMLLFSSYASEWIILKLWYSARGLYGKYCAKIYLSLVIIFVYNTTILVPGGNHADYSNIGLWLKNNTDVDSSIAMVEIGTVGWYADRYIIDILGLTNKYNANYIADGDVYSWVSSYQPDYILIHEPAWAHESAAVMLERLQMYELVPNFDFLAYRLLKKNVEYDDSEIAELPKIAKRRQQILTEMQESSELDASFVRLEGDILFAHAPSTLKYWISDVPSSISFKYGIKSGAERKHYGVCFEVVSNTSGKALFLDCISGDTGIDDLERGNSVLVSDRRGDVLLFKTLCVSSCDYAWSYWRDVSAE